MVRLLFYFIAFQLLCGTHPAYAQGRNNNWYFGTNAALNFSTGVPVAVSGSVINTLEGSASVSDAAGNLLFYTDGSLVWNSNNQLMNTNNLVLLGNGSSTQSAIILPKPGSSTEYYIFTADQGGYGGPNQGVHYSIVDMSLNSGLGGITTANVQILAPPATEKLSACRHNNCTDYWVLTHSFGDNQFQAFQVTPNGVLPPVTSNVGTPHLNNSSFNETIGHLKISPDRTKLAVTVYGIPGFAEVFNFDASTGIVSNPIVSINSNSPNGVDGFYGISFSPNSNVLYVGFSGFFFQPNELQQYDLTAGSQAAIVASEQIIATAPFGITGYGALQLGPDNKIYMVDFTSQLSVINNPDVLGSGCGFQANAVSLGTGSGAFGLPNLIDDNDGGGVLTASLGNDTVLCGGAVSLTLSAPASQQFIYSWSTGSTAQSIVVTNPGSYVLTVTDTVCNLSDSDTLLVTQLQQANYPREIFSCTAPAEVSPLLPLVSGISYSWSTGDTSSVIQVSNPGVYAVTITSGSCVVNDTVRVDFGANGNVITLNVFTPNGDGINDAFGFTTANADGFDLEVFSRWGNSLFRSSSPTQTWDGSFNGSAAEEGVYYWRVRTTDCFGNPEEQAGFVTLIRKVLNDYSHQNRNRALAAK